MTEFVGAILILSAIAEKPLFIVCVCVCVCAHKTKSSYCELFAEWKKQLLINSSLYEWTKTSG